MTPILAAEKRFEKKSDASSPDPHDSLSEADIALTDYATFFERVLGYNDSGRGIPKHQEDWADFFQDHDLAMLLSPACHGKSLLCAVGMPIWDLSRDRRERIGIVTNSDKLALGTLDAIKWHLESNERLIKWYGQFKPEKANVWNKYEIRVQQDTVTIQSRQRDASITVGGAMSRWKGIRLTRLYVDDLVDPSNSDTLEKADALDNWFWETMYTRLEPHAKVRIVGTVEREYDFYHRLIRNPRGFEIRHEKAIVNEVEKRVLWPEKWTFNELVNRRANNYVAFMKHFQNVVVTGEASKISQETIERCYDSTLKYYSHGIPDEVRKQFKYILMGVDPAWTKKKRSKYSVIKTVGIRHDDRRQVLDVFREKVEYEQLFNWIKTKYEMLRPQYVIVETNQLQERLRQELAKAAIPTIAAFTTGAKDDLLMGIPAMYSVLAASKLILPTGDTICRQHSEQFINELLAYPEGEFSDVLMAYYFIEQEIRKRVITMQIDRKSTVNGRAMRQSRFGKHYGLLGR